MWVSTIPDDPVVARWWAKAADREWAEAADRVHTRAAVDQRERIERLRRRVHKLDMALAGVQSRDRWRRIPRRGELRSAGSHGYESELWRGLPVEHSAAPGRILSVR